MQVTELNALQTKTRNAVFTDGVEYLSLGMGGLFTLIILTLTQILDSENMVVPYDIHRLLYVVLIMLVPVSVRRLKTWLRTHAVFERTGYLALADDGPYGSRKLIFGLLAGALLTGTGVFWLRLEASFLIMSWLLCLVTAVYFFSLGKYYGQWPLYLTALYFLAGGLLNHLFWPDNFLLMLGTADIDGDTTRLNFFPVVLFLVPLVLGLITIGTLRYRHFIASHADSSSSK